MEPKSTPELSLLRPALFWDTKIEKIDWQKHKKERGNEKEKNEITRFYGKQTVDEILNGVQTSL